MARLNTLRAAAIPPQGGSMPLAFEPSNSLRTHEGAPAAHISAEQELRRSVCSCLLWEREFYEDGQSIASRIAKLAAAVPPTTLATLAYDARNHFHLRHVPLLLLSVLARTGSGSQLVGDTIAETIQRADELSEFLAVYAQVNGVKPSAIRNKLSAQVKKGLARAFAQFDAYQLAKYLSPHAEAEKTIRARDVLFMVHPTPHDQEQAALWKRIADKASVQDGGAKTWEVALSAGGDKRETFEQLIREGKLGYLALLRNLRNMVDAGCNPKLVEEAIVARRGARRVLPFRYVAAARACPSFAEALDQALQATVAEIQPLSGLTLVLVDVSGSMNVPLSTKSDLTRMDAAATLAVIIPGGASVYTFSQNLVPVPNVRGLTGIAKIIQSQMHGGTMLGAAIDALANVEMDRLIVITDEQSHDLVRRPNARRAYMINVASNQHGVGYGEAWTHIDGFSEQVLRFIAEFESL